jgi:hypothetical protein
MRTALPLRLPLLAADYSSYRLLAAAICLPPADFCN